MSTQLISGLLPTVGVAIGGVIAIKTSMWLAKKVEETTGSSLGTLLGRIPPSLLQTSSNCKDLISKPIKWINRRAISLIGPRASATLVAPINEEVFYRLVLQGGIVFALTTIGIPPLLATTIAIWVQAFQFGLGHTPRVASERFSSSMLAGVVLGLIREYIGFPEAVLTHAVYNLLI